jgi:hypothetical protein
MNGRCHCPCIISISPHRRTGPSTSVKDSRRLQSIAGRVCSSYFSTAQGSRARAGNAGLHNRRQHQWLQQCKCVGTQFKRVMGSAITQKSKGRVSRSLLALTSCCEEHQSSSRIRLGQESDIRAADWNCLQRFATLYACSLGFKYENT